MGFARWFRLQLDRDVITITGLNDFDSSHQV